MKIFSEETRRKMSESAKRRCSPEWRKARSLLYSTKLPVDVVEKMYSDGSTQEEIAKRLGVTQKVISGFMRRNKIPTRIPVRRNQSGSNSSSWRGSEATYAAFHKRVETARGKPKACEKCPRTAGRFEWANQTGRYDDVNDYMRLCIYCHREMDAERRRTTGRSTSKHISKKRKEVK